MDPNGADIKTKECRNRRDATVTLPCNSTAACEVPFQGQNVKLHFCQTPERPQQPEDNPQGGNNQPQIPERLASNPGNAEQAEEDGQTVGNQGRNGRGRGRGRNGRRGNRRGRGGNQNPEQNPETDENDQEP